MPASQSYKNLTPKSDFDIGNFVGMSFAHDPSTVPASNAQNVVTKEQLPDNARVLAPGAFVTMDFVEDRLNLNLDENNRIVKAKWG